MNQLSEKDRKKRLKEFPNPCIEEYWLVKVYQYNTFLLSKIGRDVALMALELYPELEKK